MKLKCKQGDFAVWVGKTRNPANPNYGKVVRCLRFVGQVPNKKRVDRWEVDVDMVVVVSKDPKHIGSIHRTCSDGDLEVLTGTFEEMVAKVVALRVGR